MVCWSNPDPSSNLATNLEDVWNEGFVEKNLAAREVQFNWTVAPVQKCLNGQYPESFDEVIILLSMFNDIEWNKKCNTKTCLWQHLRHNSSPDAGAFWSPRHQIRGATGIPKNLKETEILSHCRRLTYSTVILPTR